MNKRACIVIAANDKSLVTYRAIQTLSVDVLENVMEYIENHVKRGVIPFVCKQWKSLSMCGLGWTHLSDNNDVAFFNRSSSAKPWRRLRHACVRSSDAFWTRLVKQAPSLHHLTFHINLKQLPHELEHTLANLQSMRHLSSLFLTDPFQVSPKKRNSPLACYALPTLTGLTALELRTNPDPVGMESMPFRFEPTAVPNLEILSFNLQCPIHLQQLHALHKLRVLKCHLSIHSHIVLEARTKFDALSTLHALTDLTVYVHIITSHAVDIRLIVPPLASSLQSLSLSIHENVTTDIDDDVMIRILEFHGLPVTLRSLSIDAESCDDEWRARLPPNWCVDESGDDHRCNQLTKLIWLVDHNVCSLSKLAQGINLRTLETLHLLALSVEYHEQELEHLKSICVLSSFEFNSDIPFPLFKKLIPCVTYLSHFTCTLDGGSIGQSLDLTALTKLTCLTLYASDDLRAYCYSTGMAAEKRCIIQVLSSVQIMNKYAEDYFAFIRI